MSEIEKMYEKCNFEKSMGVGSPVVLHPFTAEKQIELIKWLVKNQDIFKITYHREFLWCSSIELVESDCYEEFEESLADLINTVWQDLSEEEKKQVKGILE